MALSYSVVTPATKWRPVPSSSPVLQALIQCKTARAWPTVSLQSIAGVQGLEPLSATYMPRTTLSALLETRWRQWLVRAGLRQVDRDDSIASENFLTTIIGADRKFVIGGKNGSFRTEYEQDTGQASRRRVTLGAKVQVHEKVRVYSNYELANSLLGLTGLSFDQKTESLTMGVESSVLPSTRLYSEYRMRGAIDGRDHATATGIRGDYEIRKNLRVTPSFEMIQSVSEGADSIVCRRPVASPQAQ